MKAQPWTVARRCDIAGAILAALILVACFLGGFAVGTIRVRAVRAEVTAELLSAREATIYLGTREFHIAGGGVQYVVSYLRGDKVVEVPAYSIEARDRVIGEMRK